MKNRLKTALSIIMAALFIMCAAVLPIGNVEKAYADYRDTSVDKKINVTFNFHYNGLGTSESAGRTVSNVTAEAWVSISGFHYAYECTIPSYTPPAKGEFDHWLGYWTENGLQTRYSGQTYRRDNIGYTATNQTVNLYACWDKNAIVALNANGGSLNGLNSKYTNHALSGTVNITIPNGTPTKENAKFLYWTDDQGGRHYPGNTVSLEVGKKMNLKAVWENIQITYYAKLIFDANKGSGGPTSATGSGTSTNVSVVIPSGQPTRKYYTFQGWNPNKEATSGIYKAGNSCTVTCGSGNTSSSTPKEQTLYAIWSENTVQYKLTYDGNAPSGKTVNNVPSAQTATGGAAHYPTHQFTLSSTKPTCSGYTFKGWSTSNSGSVQYQPGAKGPTLTVDKPTATLYAVWQKNSTTTPKPTATPTATPKPTAAPTATPKPTTAPTAVPTATQYSYTIKYSASGASGVSGIPSNTVEYGTGATKQVTVTSSRPTRTGYTFKTWNTSADGTGTSFSPGSKITVSKNSSVTLYAIWNVAATATPTTAPTVKPTAAPTQRQTATPTQRPTTAPTQKPTAKPTQKPTQRPSSAPVQPTAAPTVAPTTDPGLTGPTINLEKTSKLTNGSKVVLFNLNNNKIISTEETTYQDYYNDIERIALTSKQAMLSDNILIVPESTQLLTVEIVNEASKTYSFHTDDNKYLVCNGTNLHFEEKTSANKNDVLFVVEETLNGEYTVKAKVPKNNQYLRFDENLFTSADLEDNNPDYTFMFFEKKNVAPVAETTPEPVDNNKAISVKAVSESNAPINGVQFVLMNPANVAEYMATTDENGIATFENVAFNMYTVTVMRAPSGYDAASAAQEPIFVSADYNSEDVVMIMIPNTAVETTPEPPVVTPEPAVESTPEPVIDVTPEPDNANSNNNNEKSTNWMLIALIGMGAIILIGAGAFVVMLSKKKKADNESYNDEDDYED